MRNLEEVTIGSDHEDAHHFNISLPRNHRMFERVLEEFEDPFLCQLSIESAQLILHLYQLQIFPSNTRLKKDQPRLKKILNLPFSPKYFRFL